MDLYTLKIRQAMPLSDKIKMTNRRIEEWINYYGENGCYVSFSGGKDSTVLLDLVRKINPNIEAVFVDTGLEYPEIRKFVKTKENITILRPKMRFDKVIEQYGYPIISKEVSEIIYNARKCIECNGKHYQVFLDKLNGNYKHEAFNCPQWKFLLDAPFKISNQCCNIMKKTPAHQYHKETGKVPFIGTMAEESRLRTQKYLQTGCNGFKNKIPTSTPIAFWTEQDVLQYIYENKLEYASVYGKIVCNNGIYSTTGCHRTGCMFCGYGCHLERYPNRFQMLAKTHPKQYEYVMNNLGFKEVLDYINVDYKPGIEKGQLKLLESEE